MAKFLEITPNKTYASQANAIKAVEAKDFPDEVGGRQLRYFVMQNAEGRWFPVFLGEVAVQAGIHFHFNIVG